MILVFSFRLFFVVQAISISHNAAHYSASVFLHLTGVCPVFSLNNLMKWLGDRNPDLSEMSATVS